MLSNNVSPGDVATASQYNNLRSDAILLSFENAVYDEDGLLLSAEINGAAVTFSYNADGQLTAVDENGTVVWEVEYDDYGNLVGILPQ